MGMRAVLAAVSLNETDAFEMAVEDVEELLETDGSLSIGPTWEVVFPLVGAITGTDLLMSAESLPVGPDQGFGPAQYIDPGQVQAIANRLSQAEETTIEDHWLSLDSPFASPGTYDDPMAKQFAIDAYQQVVALFEQARHSSQGVLWLIN